MRGFLCGALTGSMIGVIATALAMPYVEPELNRALKKCKRMVKCKMRHMI